MSSSTSSASSSSSDRATTEQLLQADRREPNEATFAGGVSSAG